MHHLVAISAFSAVLEMKWEPQNITEFCSSRPSTVSKLMKLFPPVNSEDGYTCQRFIDTEQSLSPAEYIDFTIGNITHPEPVTSGCSGQDCGGTLNLSLAMHDGIRFTWAAGDDSNSNFAFHPPLGSILGGFTMTSDSCTGTVVTQDVIGSCTAEVPEDWVPISSDSIKLTLGGKSLSVGMELLSYRGGVAVRLPSFAIVCNWDPLLLPEGCGGYQLWTYSLDDPIPAVISNPSTAARLYHDAVRKLNGVSMIHPFNTTSLLVQKGLTVAEDPCQDNLDIIACNSFSGIVNGPCEWNHTCQMSAAPTILPSNATMGIDDAVLIFDFKSWGPEFVTVRAYYWTLAAEGSEAATPTMPDPPNTDPSIRVCTEFPCERVWSASGNWTVKVRAHFEASFPGRFRETFYSAVVTKSFEVIPNPTPQPTPEPTLQPTPHPTPGPPTPAPSLAPPTPTPTIGTTAIPNTPLPTPLPPFETHAPTSVPTAVPSTPQPTPLPDACTIFVEDRCQPPCKWDGQSFCLMNPPGPLLGTEEQRSCDTCRLPVGAKIPMTFEGCTPMLGECVAHEIRFIWCSRDNSTSCFNNDFLQWDVYGEELELHLGHCDEGDSGCGLIQIKAVARVSFTTESTTMVWTEVSDARVFITADDQGVTGSPPGSVTGAPETPSPTDKKSSSSTTTPVGIIVLIIGIILVCAAAGGAFYLAKKRANEDEEYSTEEEFEEAELEEYADESHPHMGDYDEL